MPRGLNRTDLNITGISYRNGFKITYDPVDGYAFPGNIVDWFVDPAHFGNEINYLPVDGYAYPGKLVTWAINLAHFGNIIGASIPAFLLLDDGSFILLDDGERIQLDTSDSGPPGTSPGT